MKILHTAEFYSPSVGGAQEVVRQISERLVKRGHDVTIATTADPSRTHPTINGVKIVGFQVSGNHARGFQGDRQAYLDFILNEDFDIMMNYAAQQWTTDAVLPILDRVRAAKIFVPCGFSGLPRDEYSEYFKSMPDWLKKYDACVYASNDYRDVNFAREHDADQNMIMIPNGAGADEFEADTQIDVRAKLGIPQNHFLIIHVGSHTGMKGHREAMEIFKKARVKKAAFLIIANDFGHGCATSCHRTATLYRLNPLAKIADKIIISASLTRNETIAAYKEANLFLFPSNIECSPIVLYESMASQTPFLTTEVGNAKEIIKWSQGGQLLPGQILPNGRVKADVKASAFQLEQLFLDSRLRNQLSENGYRAWKANFTWEKITEQYETLYESLCEKQAENDKQAVPPRIQQNKTRIF